MIKRNRKKDIISLKPDIMNWKLGTRQLKLDITNLLTIWSRSNNKVTLARKLSKKLASKWTHKLATPSVKIITRKIMLHKNHFNRINLCSKELSTLLPQAKLQTRKKSRPVKMVLRLKIINRNLLWDSNQICVQLKVIIQVLLTQEQLAIRQHQFKCCVKFVR